jgi:two-component system NarL family sensor kinase
MAIAFLGLGGCGFLIATAPHDRLTDPLTIALAACVVVSSFVSLEIEGSIFWGGAAIPHVCAFALLGPAPAAAITVLEEVSILGVDRYRLRMFPINLFATVAPNTLAAIVMESMTASDIGYYAALTAVACSAIALNFALVTALVGLIYGEPVIARLRRHRKLLAPLAVNLAVAIASVALYRSAGIWAVVFILAGVLIFAYVVKRLTVELEQRQRISELAISRGRLVGQLLEAEDRERKVLAQMLHDEVIQVLFVARQDLREAKWEDDLLRGPVGLLDQAIEQLRGTIRATHPSILDRVGLSTAIATTAELYASRSGFRQEVAADDIDPGTHDRLIFSAVRELLANAAKHSGAREVRVSLYEHGDSVVAEVRDDGGGFEFDPDFPQLAQGHIGLASLKERVEAVGGSLDVLSTPSVDGTRVTVRTPRAPIGRLSRPRVEGPTAA